MVLFNFQKGTNGKYYQKICIYLLQIGMAPLIYMIPFFKIQPLLLCNDKDSFFDISANFTCGRDDICSGRLVKIDYHHSYLSFQTSYFKTLNQGETMFNVQCKEQSSSFLINYYICIHFLGIILAEFVNMKGNYVTLYECIGFLSFNGLVAHLYYYGIDYDLRVFFVLFFSGFLVRIFSRKNFNFTQHEKHVKRANQRDSNLLLRNANIFFCVSGILNIILYYFSMNYIWNFLIFSVASVIFFVLFFRRLKQYSDSPEDKSLKIDISINDYSQWASDGGFVSAGPVLLYLPGKMNDSFKWLYYFTFLINSISYCLFKNYIDFYSYAPFENSKTGISFLFINGISMFISELLCVVFSVSILETMKHLVFFFPLLIAILISSVEITQTIHWNPMLSVIIFSLSIFFILVLQKYLIMSFDSDLLCRYQNQRRYKWISRLSVLISSLMVNNIQYCFIIISMIYFMIFLLIFRLNNP